MCRGYLIKKLVQLLMPTKLLNKIRNNREAQAERILVAQEEQGSHQREGPLRATRMVAAFTMINRFQCSLLEDNLGIQIFHQGVTNSKCFNKTQLRTPSTCKAKGQHNNSSSLRKQQLLMGTQICKLRGRHETLVASAAVFSIKIRAVALLGARLVLTKLTKVNRTNTTR